MPGGVFAGPSCLSKEARTDGLRYRPNIRKIRFGESGDPYGADFQFFLRAHQIDYAICATCAHTGALGPLRLRWGSDLFRVNPLLVQMSNTKLRL